MKKILLAILLSCLLAQPAQAQDGHTTYLPIVTKGGRCEMTDPILRVTDGTVVIDLLGPGSGWELSDPYWQPQIAQFKGGGAFVDSGLAEGKQLVHKEYDNVIETIPLSVTGIDQGAAIQTIRDLLQLGRQSSDYWTESYEYDDVWLEAKPACANSLTGYSRIIKMSIPNLSNIFGQPFFSANSQAVMEDLTLIIEREPFWRGTPPGEIVGPLYNLIKNPDFELWNFGIGDSQPDSWTDLESLWITGFNIRDDDYKFGEHSLKVRVTGSTKAGAVKGITQVISGIKSSTEYTVIAWVRNAGVSNGVGRVLVTYSNQLELYRSSDIHGWNLYTGKITTGTGDIVAINCEILTTAANTDGTVYFDGLMFLEGDWVEEAENGTLPYLTSSHLTNGYITPALTIDAGKINNLDVWNIPGDVDALTRVEIINKTDNVAYGYMRIGQRRTNDILNFNNISDPAGTNDTTATNDSSVNIANLSAAPLLIDSKIITANMIDNLGRYRIFARVFDKRTTGATNLKAYLTYYFGAVGFNSKQLDTITGTILNNWAMLDFTPNAAVILENKNSSIIPGEISYSLSFYRPSSTEGIKFDYSLMMPTDGGFLVADFTVPLITDNTFVIDNTNSSFVGIIKTESAKWNKILETNVGDNILSVEYLPFYGGYYYIIKLVPPASDYIEKYRYGNNTPSITWSIPGSTTAFGGMETYNNKLYYSVEDLYEVTNDNFPGTLILSTPGSSLLSKAYAYNDYLYFCYHTINFPNLDLRLYRYNGTVTNQLAFIPSVSDWGGLGIIGNFEIYNNSVFINGSSSGGANVYEYNISSGIITNHNFSAAALYSYSIIKFKDRLYVGTNSDGVWSYDGYSWQKILSINVVKSMAVFGDYLIIGVSGGYSYLSSDGLTFSQIDNTILSFYQTISGVLLGSFGNIVYEYSPGTLSMISVADYQGKPFTSPPRTRNNEKRHRWVFSWDRDDGTNNIDDTILVGLGFVPRYLSLINYYPQ